MRSLAPRANLFVLPIAGAMALMVAAARPASGQGATPLGTPVAGEDTGAVTRPAGGALPPQTGFALSQLRHERVMTARLEARFAIKRLFRERGIRYPAAQIFMRIFKRERQLELWVRTADKARFELLKTYQICALAGELGPKRRQGDEQVPEGFYYIDSFNPYSDYLLSLHLDYPNRSDAVLGQSSALGGDIYIHGGCNSAGCLALTDEGIKEVYWLSVEARGVGQTRIPVHIFPARLGEQEMSQLARAFAREPGLSRFWQTLQPGYEYFERERRVPRMSVAANGRYQLAGEERFDGPAPSEPAGPAPLGMPMAAPGPPGSPDAAGATSPGAGPDPAPLATTAPRLTQPLPMQVIGKPIPAARPLGGT